MVLEVKEMVKIRNIITNDISIISIIIIGPASELERNLQMIQQLQKALGN